MKPATSPRHFLQGLLVTLFWLGVWQAVSMLVAKPVLFASPLDTIRALWVMLPTSAYWSAVLGSLGRIALGFFLALALGLLPVAFHRLRRRALRESVTRSGSNGRMQNRGDCRRPDGKVDWGKKIMNSLQPFDFFASLLQLK